MLQSDEVTRDPGYGGQPVAWLGIKQHAVERSDLRTATLRRHGRITPSQLSAVRESDILGHKHPHLFHHLVL